MCSILISLFSILFAGFRSLLALQTEILALRHQIIVLSRSANHPNLRSWDRFFRIGFLRFWPQWRSALAIVKPETFIAWYRKRFRLFWTWKCRHGKSGRPRTPKEVRDLIRTMIGNYSLWGALRNHGELLKLGDFVPQSTVAKYMFRHPKPALSDMAQRIVGISCLIDSGPSLQGAVTASDNECYATLRHPIFPIIKTGFMLHQNWRL